jgi:hypothetical protein
MARTKEQVKKGHALRARRANELAAITQCMDGWMRRQNEQLELENRQLKIKLQQEEAKTIRLPILENELAHTESWNRQLENAIEHAVTRISRRDARIRELETTWEDMANTLHSALEDLEKYRLINRNLTEQVLDCTCTESEFETDTLNSQ